MRVLIYTFLCSLSLSSCTCNRSKKELATQSAQNTQEPDHPSDNVEQADVVIFDKDYVYDAENPDIASPAYDISRSYIFHPDGTGDFQSEDAGKFRWNSDVKEGVTYVVITDIFDIKDPDGVPYPEQDQSGMDQRFEVSSDKKVLTEVAENGLVLTLSL